MSPQPSYNSVWIDTLYVLGYAWTWATPSRNTTKSIIGQYEITINVGCVSWHQGVGVEKPVRRSLGDRGHLKMHNFAVRSRT